MKRILFKGIFKGKSPGIVRIAAPASSGGGSVPDIDFDVNPDYNQDQVLAGDEAFFYIRLSNTSDNPSGVELSFSDDLLKSVSFDDGTESSPSYVIESGGFRDITIRRGSGAPIAGAGEVCTISYKLSDGTVVDYTSTITVNPPTIISLIVNSIIGEPTLQYNFVGKKLSYENGTNTNTNNTGSFQGSGSDYDSHNLRAVNTKEESLPTPKDYVWVDGFMDSGKYQQLSHTNVSKTNRSLWAADSDKTWIWVFKTVNGPRDVDAFGYGETATNTDSHNGPGYGSIKSTGFRFKTQISDNSDITVVLDDSASSSGNIGAATAYPVGETATKLGSGSNELGVICCSFDAASSTMTYMYRSSNQTNGFTYKEVSSHHLESISVGVNDHATYLRLIYTYSYYTFNAVRVYYTSVVDSSTSKEDFNAMLTGMGLNT